MTETKKPILLIGDIHGKIPQYERILNEYENSVRMSIQLGDMGIGFRGIRISPSKKHKFFAGNHDHPGMCHAHPNCLGKYGVIEPGLFFLSGADSIDKQYRTEGLDWWPDEQLGREDMEAALEAYTNARPDILLTHEAPFAIHQVLKAAAVTRSPENEAFGPAKGNSTAFLLDSMLQRHMPKKVYFGHWHVGLKYIWRGCEFTCIDELKTELLYL